GVDVDGPFAVPGRLDLIVPETLEICRLRTGPRAGDEKIPAKIEVKRSEIWIGFFCDSFEAFVGRKISRIRFAEPKLHPAEKLLVIGDVSFEHLIKRFLRDRFARGVQPDAPVSADIFITSETFRRREDDGC